VPDLLCTLVRHRRAPVEGGDQKLPLQPYLYPARKLVPKSAVARFTGMQKPARLSPKRVSVRFGGAFNAPAS
jgi:hypothetical protein